MPTRLLLIAMLTATECNNKPATTHEPGPAQPTGAAPVAGTTVPAPDDKAGAAPPPGDDAQAASDGAAAADDECLSACVRSRQMQAIAAQTIESNCRADCESGKLEP